MAMKRRGFLAMLGASIAAPVLAVAAAPQSIAAATYNRTIYGMAVFHARTRAHITVRGLATRMQVTPIQAKAMIAEMSQAGLVVPVGAGGDSVRAVSRIYEPRTLHVPRRKVERTNVSKVETVKGSSPTAARLDVDLSAFLTHLRRICVAQGMPLSPACQPV